MRARGNLLLCTLLFGNVCVNSAISIVLSDITSGAVGLLLSTVIIVILGMWWWAVLLCVVLLRVLCVLMHGCVYSISRRYRITPTTIKLRLLLMHPFTQTPLAPTIHIHHAYTMHTHKTYTKHRGGGASSCVQQACIVCGGPLHMDCQFLHVCVYCCVVCFAYIHTCA